MDADASGIIITIIRKKLMDILPFSAMFVVLGAHITENLEHHKSADVKRILEDKGFKESGSNSDNAVHFYSQEGNPANGKRTIIIFGEKDFVQAQDGVKHYDTTVGSGQ